MARRRKRGVQGSVESVEESAESVQQEDEEGHQPHVQSAEEIASSLLKCLDSGGRIAIHRKNPRWAEGHCGMIAVDADENPSDLLTHIKQRWGGGTYSLRPVNDNGQYVTGVKSITMTGTPREDGEPYVNREPPDPSRNPPHDTQPVQPPPPVVVQAAPPAAGGSEGAIAQMLGNMVTSFSNGRIQDMVGYNQQMMDLVKNAGSVQNAATNPLGQVQQGVQMMGELAKVAKAMNGGGGGGSSSDDGDGEMSMEKMMMMKMMMDMGMRPPQMGMPQQGMMPQQQVPQQQVPQGYWGGQPQWQGPQNGQQPIGYTQQGQPIFQGPTQQQPSQASQQPQQPQQQPSAPSPSGQAQPMPSQNSSSQNQEEDEEPIDAEDVATRINELGRNGDGLAAAHFMSQVFARMDPEVSLKLQQLQQQAQGQQPTPQQPAGTPFHVDLKTGSDDQ